MTQDHKPLDSETPSAEATPAPPPAEEALKALEAEVADLKDRLLRQMAETENVRRRADRERQEAARYGIAPFARDLVGVADNLARAIQAIPTERREEEVIRTLIAGVEMTEKELIAAFEKNGLKRIAPDGEMFDANYHQAVAEVPHPSKSGTVVTVIQPGYKIEERLIRPALVVIAKAIPSAVPANDEGEPIAPEPGEAGAPGSRLDTSA